jgi:hypothetical protein
VTSVTTMYVPPSVSAPIDAKMLERLGIKQSDRVRCLQLKRRAG